MKSRILIAKLQEIDPGGDTDVCLSNGEIWNITREPAYYDGSYHKIEFDLHGRPITGQRIREGEKINLDPCFIQDAFEYEGFKVLYKDDVERRRYEAGDIEAVRSQKEVDLDAQRDAFCNWIFKKVQQQKYVPLAWVERIVDAAAKFYDENKLGPDRPKIVCRPGKDTRRTEEEFWEDNVYVNWDEYSRLNILFSIPADQVLEMV